MNIKESIEKHGNDPLIILKEAGGYYECPKDSNSKRLGPVVGYAGKYTDESGVKKQYVGDVYANFARAEQYPQAMEHFAKLLKEKLDANSLGNFDLVVGPQMGGVAAAIMLALVSGARYACAEKEIIAMKTESMREQSKLIFGRHNIEQGDKVVIMEDVLNNFSTSEETISLIENNGGQVIAILALLNRSPNIDTSYEYKGTDARTIPVISFVRKDIVEYTQEDPAVKEDIEKGNVVLKPKSEWSTLMQASE